MHSLLTGLRSRQAVITGLLMPPPFVDNGDYNPALETHVFTITSRTASRIPALSTQRHRYHVDAENGDAAADPTDFVMQIAYYSNRAVDPETLTWIDMEWDDDNCAYIVVGPDEDSDLYLLPGAYFRMIRTKARPRVAIPLPTLVIEKPNGR